MTARSLLAELQEAHRSGEDFRFASELVIAWPRVEELIEAAQDTDSWLENAGAWLPDDPEFLATMRKLRAALAALTEAKEEK